MTNRGSEKLTVLRPRFVGLGSWYKDAQSKPSPGAGLGSRTRHELVAVVGNPYAGPLADSVSS
jgi:hypothetical protein